MWLCLWLLVKIPLRLHVTFSSSFLPLWIFFISFLNTYVKMLPALFIFIFFSSPRGILQKLMHWYISNDTFSSATLSDLIVNNNFELSKTGYKIYTWDFLKEVDSFYGKNNLAIMSLLRLPWNMDLVVSNQCQERDEKLR
jgi:hypothetical protein